MRFDLYLKPQASSTCTPSGSMAFGTQRQRCAVSAATGGDRQSLDRGEGHRAVAFEPAMLRRDFSRLVLKLPRRIREDRLEGLPLVNSRRSSEAEIVAGKSDHQARGLLQNR